MNINIENYEEFFLLYADNELTEAQKQIVEMFVKSNPLLQKKFNDIQATILSPGEISYSGKSFLYKSPSESFIDLNNYEERFVEYFDGNLNEEQVALIEDFISDNEGLKQEFELIGKTRLEPEMNLVYPGKEDLYRHASNVRYFSFVKIAVAAAVLVFIVWFGVNYFGDREPGSAPIATILPVSAKKDSPVTAPVKINADREQDTSPQIADAKEKVIIEKEKKESKVQYAAKSPATIRSKIDIRPKIVMPAENVVQNEKEIKNPGLKNSLDINPGLPQQEIKQMTAIASHVDKDITPMTEAQPEVTYASFGPEPTNDYVFFDIPAENLRRSKVGVFIKKVKRTIDRNNPINRLFNSEELE